MPDARGRHNTLLSEGTAAVYQRRAKQLIAVNRDMHQAAELHRELKLSLHPEDNRTASSTEVADTAAPCDLGNASGLFRFQLSASALTNSPMHERSSPTALRSSQQSARRLSLLDSFHYAEAADGSDDEGGSQQDRTSNGSDMWQSSSFRTLVLGDMGGSRGGSILAPRAPRAPTGTGGQRRASATGGCDGDNSRLLGNPSGSNSSSLSGTIDRARRRMSACGNMINATAAAVGRPAGGKTVAAAAAVGPPCGSRRDSGSGAAVGTSAVVDEMLRRVAGLSRMSTDGVPVTQRTSADGLAGPRRTSTDGLATSPRLPARRLLQDPLLNAASHSGGENGIGSPSSRHNPKPPSCPPSPASPAAAAALSRGGLRTSVSGRAAGEAAASPGRSPTSRCLSLSRASDYTYAQRLSPPTSFARMSYDGGELGQRRDSAAACLLRGGDQPARAAAPPEKGVAGRAAAAEGEEGLDDGGATRTSQQEGRQQRGLLLMRGLLSRSTSSCPQKS